MYNTKNIYIPYIYNKLNRTKIYKYNQLQYTTFYYISDNINANLPLIHGKIREALKVLYYGQMKVKEFNNQASTAGFITFQS
jgi:hypothetical protein